MKKVEKAIEILNEGGIVIFPTDTAFGIGCKIDSEKSVKRLFEIRKRPKDKAMPVLFASIGQVREYVLSFDDAVEDLMRNFWPGALTLVLPCKVEKVPKLVRGGEATLGVRIPDGNLVLGLIRGVGVPIIGTSANFAGEKTPFSFRELDKNIVKKVDYVLDGKTKGLNKSSTVIDLTKNPWSIIRQGDVKIKI